jgi:hypothetical protein
VREDGSNGEASRAFNIHEKTTRSRYKSLSESILKPWFNSRIAYLEFMFLSLSGWRGI